MSRLPATSGRQLIAALKHLGFEVVRTKGSHSFLRHADGRATVVGRGLMAKILRDTELSANQLRNVTLRL